jgi:inosose dehydratase
MAERTRMSTAMQPIPTNPLVFDRIAAAPISWGVCEVPGWGTQLAPELVLADINSLGVHAVEAGPDGYLGDDPDHVRALLDANGLQLVGGFLPIVLHDASRLEWSIAQVHRKAAFFASLGAYILNTALVVDEAWSPPIRLTAEQWAHMLAALPLIDQAASEHGVVQAVHPHWGTLVERDAEVRRLLDESSASICLDTGHLALGGSDVVELVETYGHRVVHVHLKDVDATVARRLQSGELSLIQATQAGLFRPLGSGDARVGEAVALLERVGYTGWYVLEQDASLADGAGSGQAREDAQTSIGFLQRVVARTNEV